MRPTTRQRGFTLTELGIALAVIAVLTAIVAGSVGVLRPAQQAKATLDGTEALIAVATERVRGNTTVSTHGNDLITLGGLPGSMIDRATTPATLRWPWGAAATVTSAFSSAAVARIDALDVLYPGMPTAVCQTVINGLEGRALRIEGPAVIRANRADPVTAAELETFCAAAPAGTVSIRVGI